MLVLTRKPGEQIVIRIKDYDVMKITVVAVAKGDKVRLGFEARPIVSIFRKEVWERMEEEHAAIPLQGLQT